MALVGLLTSRSRRWFSASLLYFVVGTCSGADWVRGGTDTNQTRWGLRGGLQFAISPGGFTSGSGGPRGLIRIGSPTLPGGQYDLINFIAIEPVVGGVRGYSELEKSRMDGQSGKFFCSGPLPSTNGQAVSQSPGVVSSPQPGVEELAVPLYVEKFDNGAHVRLVLSQRSDAPDELRLTVHAEPDSAPIQSCILTATMGNRARARQLWLKNGAVSSLKHFGDYTGPDFTSKAFFTLSQLTRNVAGDVVAVITTDEADPSAVAGQVPGWEYRGAKVAQYWRKPASGLSDSLQCAVNARFKYWLSQNPIPGGLAYENFELVEDFKDGQQSIFGVTTRLKPAPPRQLQVSTPE